MHEQIMIEPAISLETIGRVYKMISEIPYFSNSRINVIEILPGGITNSNYKVTIDEVTYAVRLAGVGTIEYINRPAEKHNAQVMADMGISATIIYYDETTGNQVCKYIDDSKTLHGEDFKDENYLILAARVFRKYHDGNIEFYCDFNPLKEIDAYIKLLADKNYGFYEGSETMVQKIEEIKELFKKNPPPKAPCHNDPLPVNWLDDKKNFYLIDWEYAGTNDPIFDLAALSIEAEFTEEQEQFLLTQYFGGKQTEQQLGSLVINKFLCDVLWAYWSILQIAMGKPKEEYWEYGLNRFNRAYDLIYNGSLDRSIKANQ
ncbi:choline/ethanolamine kinase family protein [Desulfosporosinus sp. BICA1-9]|uniref:choline/ethanolamine kinase family protein n=1 Tax=Desulfosporosinus sp. BICA1-9 TaxID=1531958 RepID=UPI00054BEB28|nr:choline/ethanolamine kinase family protein [Desulfosporosinus sp. BICA1-9]KJS46015.1 MAG: choline kinase [Peptococcaceae bacterium BRH_c23]KJS80314.1 MAG: choline kinase [Desulfosporosinus sp. BICA1-9]HBW37632.1 choline kinase [Desulfosporosinus sp.]